MPLQRAVSDHITALGDGEGLRILATAGGDLRRLVRGGAFDPDLAEHLNRRAVTVPTLRERAEDLIPLAFAFGRAASNDALRPLSQRLTLALSSGEGEMRASNEGRETAEGERTDLRYHTADRSNYAHLVGNSKRMRSEPTKA